MNYRYSLEKGSKKFTCPSCGAKRRFRRYIDNQTGQYIGNDVGKCDRINECEYHKPPRMAGKKIIPPPVFQKRKPKKKKISFIPFVIFRKTLIPYHQNSFITGLLKLFNSETVTSLIEKYHIGTINNKVVFWQVDEYMRIRTGKIMKYDPGKLKRIGYPNWIHTYFALKNFNYDQCLFGLHLIKELDINTPICVVESEKTAIMMSGYYPEFTWMATGSANMLSEERIKSIMGHPVFLYADIGMEKLWAKKMLGINNVKIVFWDKALKIDSKEHTGDDLADFNHPTTKMPLPYMKLKK